MFPTYWYHIQIWEEDKQEVMESEVNHQRIQMSLRLEALHCCMAWGLVYKAYGLVDHALQAFCLQSVSRVKATSTRLLLINLNSPDLQSWFDHSGFLGATSTSKAVPKSKKQAPVEEYSIKFFETDKTIKINILDAEGEAEAAYATVNRYYKLHQKGQK
ncbi:acyl-CoA-binding domain-containing protein 4-like [Iris pallida]|uniref:Acyl-CoA-binding domain-containing protein 4-like n=1 Tax=Iris pallida TaxID=29817 RepID=A0AAX6F5D5_IRIPA|nr:acyl-CoA-binding domain-containing protein 4-like [Iris pallida]